MLYFFADVSPEKPPKRKRQLAVKRERWTSQEEEELKQLFSEFVSKRECPGQKDCELAISLSKQNGGLVCHRKRDNIKKKVHNMIQKVKGVKRKR